MPNSAPLIQVRVLLKQRMKERKILMPKTLYVTIEHEIHADNEQCSLDWAISEKNLLIQMGLKCFGA